MPCNAMKYKLTDNTRIVDGHTLYQIKALEFTGIPSGALGGWLETPYNLDQKGNCWVYQGACVYGDACVTGSAEIFGNAQVYGHAQVREKASVHGNARVYNHATVHGRAEITGTSEISGEAYITDQAFLRDAIVKDHGVVHEFARVLGGSVIKIGIAGSFARVTQQLTTQARVLTGLNWTVTILDKHMQIGCKCRTFQAWKMMTDSDIDEMHPDALEFWTQYKDILLALCDSQGGGV